MPLHGPLAMGQAEFLTAPPLLYLENSETEH